MIVLTYDQSFAKPNTFFLLKDDRTLRCRIMEASSPEVVCDLALRWRKPRGGALRIRPLSSELDEWHVESAIVHEDLARVTIHLTRVPALVASKFQKL